MPSLPRLLFTPFAFHTDEVSQQFTVRIHTRSQAGRHAFSLLGCYVVGPAPTRKQKNGHSFRNARFPVLLLLSYLCSIVFPISIVVARIVCNVTGSVFHFAHSIASFTFELVHGAFGLSVFIACPFADLALCATSNVFRLPLNAVLVHRKKRPPIDFVTLAFRASFSCAVQ